MIVWWTILCLCLMFVGGFLIGFHCGVKAMGKRCVDIVEDAFPHLKGEVKEGIFRPNIRGKNGSINKLSTKLK